MADHDPELPRQARSRAALERFLDAGAALLDEHAFETTSISDLAERAGSSVGTFYRLIGERDRLFEMLHDRFIADSHERIATRLDPAVFGDAPFAAVLRGFVTLLVEVYSTREGILRALIVRSSGDVSFRERVHSLNAHLGESLAVLARPHLTSIDHPDPAAALQFGAKVVLGALNHHVLVGSLETHRPRVLVEELTRVLVRYLGADGDA